MTGGVGGGPNQINHVFEALVRSDDPVSERLRGMIAYSIYKSAKRDWYKSECERRGGLPPTEDDWKQFASFWTTGRVEGLRTEAQAIVNDFADVVYDALRANVERDVLKEALEEIDASTTRGVDAGLKNKFWSGVWGNVMGAFFYTLALIVLAAIASFVRPDILDILEGVGKSVTGGA